MINPRGQIDLSMPSERFFLTIVDEEGEVIQERMPRRTPDGAIAFGQRTFQPHTIQTRSVFSDCNRCHIASDRSNEAQVRLAVGFGSERMIVLDGEGNAYRLDALMEEDGTLLIEVGHFGEEASRPLDLEMANWLLNTPIEDM
jgi:hypothetical protein